MKYGVYWCVVHNSEYDHHNLFLAHSIFLLLFRSFSPTLQSSHKYCIHLFDSSNPPPSRQRPSLFCISFFPLWIPFHSVPSPSPSLCSLAPDTFTLMSVHHSLTLSTFPPSLFQVRGGQQGLFSSCTDAWCPSEGLGHVGWLFGEHLCQGPPAPFGSLCHHLLPPRLPPPKREQVPQIPGKGEMGTGKEAFCFDYPC